MFPKIELHVHLEGTVRPGALLQIARRNGVPLPADSVEGLAALYEFRDFAHFLYQAGLRGALCDQGTRLELQQIGESFDWAGPAPAGQP